MVLKAFVFVNRNTVKTIRFLLLITTEASARIAVICTTGTTEKVAKDIAGQRVPIYSKSHRHNPTQVRI